MLIPHFFFSKTIIQYVRKESKLAKKDDTREAYGSDSGDAPVGWAGQDGSGQRSARAHESATAVRVIGFKTTTTTSSESRPLLCSDVSEGHSNKERLPAVVIPIRAAVPLHSSP